MESPYQFYAPVIEWLNRFVSQYNDSSPIQFDFRLRYYNTGSSRMFFDIFSLFEKTSPKVTINWYAEGKDADMIDEGDCFREDFPLLDFNVIVQEKVAF